VPKSRFLLPVSGVPSEEGRRTEDEMSANEYIAGFIGMAVLIALILSIGTLRMAGLVHRPHWHHHHSA
jgi:hypothetical protein